MGRSSSSSSSSSPSLTCGITSPLTSCTEACQSIAPILSPTNNELTCLHPSHFFQLHNPHHHEDEDGDYHENHIAGSNSPVMYSNHAPVLHSAGLARCEYCGSSNVRICEGVREVKVQYQEYQRRMMGVLDGNVDDDDGGAGAASSNNEDNGSLTANGTTNNNTSHNNDNNNDNATKPKCHRPKLFFLKKRPPFATSSNSSGWNPQTQHRTQLFEPPSSMEGVGRGYGEVRGRLGDYCTVNYCSTKFHPDGGSLVSGRGSMRGGYEIYKRSQSLPLRGTLNGSGNNNGPCGSVCGETEISFLSASHHASNGGRRSPVVMMNNHHTNGNGENESSEAGRSLSPLQWVNGSEIKGVMNWFA